MNSAEPPFDLCPRCGYSLRGLPADHACPECGLGYDHECEMYRAVKPIPVFASMGGLFAVFGLVNVFRGFPSWPIEWQIITILLGALCIAVVVFAVRRLRMLNRRGRYVAVTGDGLLVRMERLKPEFIPWIHISRVRLRSRPRGVTIFIKDKTLVHRIDGVFAKQQDTDRFVEQVEARIRAIDADAPGGRSKGARES